MTKYLILTLIALSSVSFASDKSSAKLGQIDNSYAQNDCNAPQIAGCGPCYKLCIEQNKSDRGAKDTSSSSPSKVAPSGKGSATKQ